MQTILPDNFPIADLPPTERYKLEAYYDRFVVKRYREYGMGHLWLACYAALPAVMTPDLLYKLWLNFSSYLDGQETRIHHVAVADLLLSPLFQEISFETYEMQVDLKNALLKYWQSEVKNGNFNRLATLESVAQFLLGYTRVFRTNDTRAGDAFREAQAITAWSYLDTQRASAMLMRSLEQASKKAREEPGSRLARAEQLRLLEVAHRTGQRHDLGLMADGQTKPDNIQALAGYSQQLQGLLSGKEEDVLRILQQSGSQLQLSDEPGSGISIKAPTALVKKAQPDDQDQEKGKLFLLLAGIDDYPDTGLQLRGCKNDVDNLVAALGQLGYQAQQSIVLKDGQVTRAVFEKSLMELLGNAGPHDQLLLFFAGHTTRIGDDCNLVFFDSGQKDNYRGMALREIFSHHNRTKGEQAYLTILLDTELESLETPNPKIAVITGGGMEMGDGSRFMNTLLPIWTRSKGRLSLQKLVAAARSQTASNPSPAPARDAANSYSNYDEPVAFATTRSDGTDRLPDLFAFPDMARQPLIRTSSALRYMQALLRSTGFYQGSTNGIYNQDTDTALRAFLTEKEVKQTPSLDRILQLLEEEKKWRDSTYPKILLFIFSNPENRLPAVAEEKERLLSLADEMEKRTGAEMVFLDNPSRQELISYFTDASYRNQLLLFHFSGFESDPDGNSDERGMFLQTGAETTIVNYGELHRWLDYQENLRLFYLNTCHSAELAKTLTIRGVRASIGATGVVSDSYAAEFAHLFYQNLLKGLPLQEAFERNSLEPFGEGRHRSAAPDEGSPPAGFRIFFDWGRREEAANWKWDYEPEQAKTAGEKPKQTATGLYLETLKELLAEDNMETVLNKLLVFSGLSGLEMENDLIMQQARFKDNEKQYELGLVRKEQLDRVRNQIRFSLLNMIDEIPRKLALQKAAGEARWMEFILPAEDDRTKFDSKPGLLDWLEKGLAAAKAVGLLSRPGGEDGMGFLVEGPYFICPGALIPDREACEKARINLFFAEQKPKELIPDPETLVNGLDRSLDYAAVRLKSDGRNQDGLPEPVKIGNEASLEGSSVLSFYHEKSAGGPLILRSTRATMVEGVFLENTWPAGEGPSTGAPVFDANWNVVAMQLAGPPTEAANSYQQESPVDAGSRCLLIASILTDIERRPGNDYGSYAA